MKIGLCGGTFDPFHRGHLDPILSVREAVGWDRIVYIPAAVQPFKQERDTASAYHRFTMAVLSTEEHDEVYVSPRELERGAVSYTVDTLQQVRSEHPADTLDWIIGDDNVAKLEQWRSIDTIFELANFVVLTREPSPPEVPPALRMRVTDAAAKPASGAIVFVRNTAVPVSSTEIRRRARAGEPIDDLVAPRVSRYIQHNGLYRKGQS